MRKKKSGEAPIATQRTWTHVVLAAGLVGLVVAIGLKLGRAAPHPGILLSLSLGLICLALGLGFRLEQRERSPRRAGSARVGVSFDRLLLAFAFLLIAVSALLSMG